MRVYKAIAGLAFIIVGWSACAQAQQVDRWSTPPKFMVSRSDVTVTSTATLVCPSNDNRVNCTCVNTGADAVRYGDSTISATKGARIAAGNPAEIRVRGNIYMVSEGADTTLACTEEVY